MGKIVKCNTHNIILTAECVKKGGIIIYPTDTVYGLGADPYNKDAVNKIYKIKEREKSKPFPLLCSSIEIVNSIAYLDHKSIKLIKKFWPGALTLILKLKDERLKTTLSIDNVGVRIPNSECALNIIKACNGILIGTSANLSGKKSARTVDELDPMLIERVDLVLYDNIKLGVESSIIDMINKKIIREGYIKREEIESVLNEL